MYLCSKCGSNAFLNLDRVTTVITTPQITANGLVVNKVSVLRKPLATTRIASSFTCPVCGELNSREVLVECSGCFKHFKAEDLVIFNELGGQYCKENCSERYESEGYKPISAKDLLYTVKLKQE